MKPQAIVVCIALSILTVGPASGQSAPGDGATARLADDVRGIREALDRLVAVMETAGRQQEIELVLRRIELRERRLDPLERRLRDAEREVEGLDSELSRMEVLREQAEEKIREEVREGTDTPQSETRLFLEEIERSLEMVDGRTEDARARARRYEDELADGRRQIEVLDDLLLDLLNPTP